MQSEGPPEEIVELARARARARATRDWPVADRLRAEIEGAGWRVVDRGTDFSLHVAHPPDTLVDGVMRYGWSGSVPSRLDEPPVGRATVVAVTNGDVHGLERTIASVGALDGASLVVVADDPSPDEETLIAGVGGATDAGAGGAAAAVEVVRTSTRLSVGAARNAGLRRTSGPIVVVARPGTELSKDRLTAVEATLADPTVAVTGDHGVDSSDLRRFTDAAAGDVAALAGGMIAFRRDDLRDRGPLDERFATPSSMDIWWSLVLRDAGTEVPPRRAVALDRSPDGGPAGTSDRAVKRDRYRVGDRFGGRRELAVQGGREARAQTPPATG